MIRLSTSKLSQLDFVYHMQQMKLSVMASKIQIYVLRIVLISESQEWIIL